MNNKEQLTYDKIKEAFFKEDYEAALKTAQDSQNKSECLTCIIPDKYLRKEK
ncbi:hypothetical protein UFOVP270_49 [uncultured Caudovirales phage]|uniref:Uncharacterized protein n=1 Tax=uncultured Caudovirales phage TaxID=2100421 RepID=A0A6J5L0T1_9CAUD|nr:hypothetical protein UFOVP101_8 [uncultured Caudovirales phage]CAB4134368.1 hypothetical protein UFOVP270_49 [uncultured Caudovirales phage]